jgi:hypothetical protein
VARAPEILEFVPPDLGAVVATMEELDRVHAGWLNLQPEVTGAPARRRSALVSLFERRPPELTLATWTPSGAGRGRVEVPTVGVQHARAETVGVLVGTAGLAIPETWRVLQDRPRIGLVARLPPGTANEDTLRWLLQAVEAVSSFPVTGKWRALVYRR